MLVVVRSFGLPVVSLLLGEPLLERNEFPDSPVDLRETRGHLAFVVFRRLTEHAS